MSFCTPKYQICCTKGLSSKLKAPWFLLQMLYFHRLLQKDTGQSKGSTVTCALAKTVSYMKMQNLIIIIITKRYYNERLFI